MFPEEILQEAESLLRRAHHLPSGAAQDLTLAATVLSSYKEEAPLDRATLQRLASMRDSAVEIQMNANYAASLLRGLGSLGDSVIGYTPRGLEEAL